MKNKDTQLLEEAYETIANTNVFKKILRKYKNNGRLSDVLDSLYDLKYQGNKDADRIYRNYNSGRIAGSESELLAALEQLAKRDN